MYNSALRLFLRTPVFLLLITICCAENRKTAPPVPLLEKKGVAGLMANNAMFLESKDKSWAISPSDSSGGYEIWLSRDASSWIKSSGRAPWSTQSYFTPLMFQDRLWILGGAGEIRRFNDVWNSEDGVKWNYVSSRAEWRARYGFACAVFKERLWVLGGLRRPEGVLNDVWHSGNGMTWKRVSSPVPWAPRIGLKSLVFRGRLYIYGGYSSDLGGRLYSDAWSTSDGEKWRREKWTDLPDLMFKEKLWILGGSERRIYGHSHEMDNSILYSEDGTKWSQVEQPVPRVERLRYKCAIFAGRLWIAGGSRRTEVEGEWIKLKDAWYSEDGINWHQVTE